MRCFLLCLLFPLTSFASPLLEATPSLASDLATSLKFVKTGLNPKKEISDCSKAQKEFLEANPSLQTALESYRKNAKKTVAQCFEDEFKCNLSAHTTAGYAAVKAACSAAGGDLFTVHQNVSCYAAGRSVNIRNDLTCIVSDTEVCPQKEVDGAHLQAMKLLKEAAEGQDKNGEPERTCGGSFSIYKAYKWYHYLPVSSWLCFVALCFWIAQAQKKAGARN